MSESTSAKLVGAAIVAGVLYAAFLWPHVETWDGDGSIDVFPSSDSVKNYRLDATMTVTQHRTGWFKREQEYSDITGSWPNGGTLELGSCTVPKDGRSSCTDQDDKEYEVEVVSAPDQPPADDYDNN